MVHPLRFSRPTIHFLCVHHLILLQRLIILACIRGSVTNSIGLWIGWLNLLALLYNQWLSTDPFLTGLRVSSLPLWRMPKEEFFPTELNEEWRLTYELELCSNSAKRQSQIATDGQSIRSLGVEPQLLLFDSYGLVLWGALSDERTGLSFIIYAAGPRQRSLSRVRVPFIYAAGPRQRSLSQVRVPWDSWPYFTLRF
jgi:hypothetical protein